MKRLGFFYSAMFVFSVFANTSQAQTSRNPSKKAIEAAAVLDAVVSIPDKSIPKSLLDKAVCVVTLPQVIRAGFIFGGRYGEGLASCRVGDSWSAPSFVKLAGGSWGAQIGIGSIDLVLIFVSTNAYEKLSKDNFTLGVNATVAAGPLGRDANLGTDYQLNSEIYSYSRARGLFAGLTVDGSSLNVDKKENAKVYGTDMSALSILNLDGRFVPGEVTPYVDALLRISRQ